MVTRFSNIFSGHLIKDPVGMVEFNGILIDVCDIYGMYGMYILYIATIS